MKKAGNYNEAFEPDPTKPFWDQQLNPITMFPVKPNYFEHSKQPGYKSRSPFKRTNHFTKNFT